MRIEHQTWGLLRSSRDENVLTLPLQIRLRINENMVWTDSQDYGSDEILFTSKMLYFTKHPESQTKLPFFSGSLPNYSPNYSGICNWKSGIRNSGPSLHTTISLRTVAHQLKIFIAANRVCPHRVPHSAAISPPLLHGIPFEITVPGYSLELRINEEVSSS